MFTRTASFLAPAGDGLLRVMPARKPALRSLYYYIFNSNIRPLQMG